MLKLPKRKLKQERATRWNSSYDMIHRLVEHKDAVNLVPSYVEHVDNLTAAEQKCAADNVTVLQPFEEATAIMSATKYPTLSMVIPMMNILVRRLRSKSAAEAVAIDGLRAKLLLNIQQRWPNFEQDPLYAVSSLLDPRFKRFTFTSEINAAAAQNLVLDKMMQPPLEGDQTAHESESDPLPSPRSDADNTARVAASASSLSDNQQEKSSPLCDAFDVSYCCPYFHFGKLPYIYCL
jgi:hypothetical protein